MSSRGGSSRRKLLSYGGQDAGQGGAGEGDKPLQATPSVTVSFDQTLPPISEPAIPLHNPVSFPTLEPWGSFQIKPLFFKTQI